MYHDQFLYDSIPRTAEIDICTLTVNILSTMNVSFSYNEAKETLVSFRFSYVQAQETLVNFSLNYIFLVVLYDMFKFFILCT
jgi:hypothetical protein